MIRENSEIMKDRFQAPVSGGNDAGTWNTGVPHALTGILGFENALMNQNERKRPTEKAVRPFSLAVVILKLCMQLHNQFHPREA